MLVALRVPAASASSTALVDLPFALPTAVAGLVYSSLYVANGWLGQFLVPLGIEGAYSPAGHRAGADVHRLAVRRADRAAGAARPRRRVGGGRRRPRGDALADVLARDPADADAGPRSPASRWPSPAALGEYGSVVFVSGNMPFQTEIAPVLIVARLEEFAYAEATAIAVVLLALSFALLVADQPARALEQAPWRLTCSTPSHASARPVGRQARRPVAAHPRHRDPLWSRWTLTLPGAGASSACWSSSRWSTSSSRRSASGVGAYLRSPVRRRRHAARDPPDADRRAGRRWLLNMVFGVAAAWAIARFRFPGRTLLIALIDLPFSRVAGRRRADVRADLRPAGLPRAVAAASTTSRSSSRLPGLILATAFVTLPVRGPRADPGAWRRSAPRRSWPP